MKNTLEKVWYAYLNENRSDSNSERQQILEKLCVMSKDITSGMTKEEKKRLDVYENLIYEMNEITVREAFRYGVSFTASFLIEALYKD